MTSKCGTFPFKLIIDNTNKQLHLAKKVIKEAGSTKLTDYIPENIRKARINLNSLEMNRKIKLRDGTSVAKSLLFPNDYPSSSSQSTIFSDNESSSGKVKKSSRFEEGELEEAAKELESLLQTSKDLLPPWSLVSLEYEDYIFYVKWKLCTKEFRLPDHQIINQFLIKSKKMISRVLGDLLMIKPAPKTCLVYVPTLDNSIEEEDETQEIKNIN